MVLHFRPPMSLGRTVRFITFTITNIVGALKNSAMLEEDTAWEATFEGALDAFAQRLARDRDGVAKSFEIGDALAEKVRRLQQTASLPA